MKEKNVYYGTENPTISTSGYPLSLLPSLDVSYRMTPNSSLFLSLGYQQRIFDTKAMKSPILSIPNYFTISVGTFWSLSR